MSTKILKNRAGLMGSRSQVRMGAGTLSAATTTVASGETVPLRVHVMLTSLVVPWVLGVAIAAGADPETPPAASRRPPNFVLIMADDLGAPELGCYGNTAHHTPRLDRLAETGVRFETCWATPLCSSTRVELMTGRYGFRTGWYTLIGRPYAPPDRIDADEQTFADMLKPRGYVSGLAGKWQLGTINDHPRMIFDSGFDAYYTWAWIELPTNANFPGSPRQRYWHPAVIADGKHVPTNPDDYGPDLYCNWLIEFMRKNRDRPFMAYYPMCLTHQPWDPTPVVGKPGEKTGGGLKPNVEYMDHLVGRIVDALDEMGLRDNTILIFTGDNGTQGAGKGKVTEMGARVPLIVNAPGRIEPKVSGALVDLSDVMPTLAELSGAELPKGVEIDGKSFAPVLRGESEGVRDWIFSYLDVKRMLRDKRWLLEGDGRFYDCGDSREGKGYRDVTDSKDAEVVAARARFDKLLEKLPGPKPLPKKR